MLEQRKNHYTREEVGLGLFSTLAMEMNMRVGIDVNHSAEVFHLNIRKFRLMVGPCFNQ